MNDERGTRSEEGKTAKDAKSATCGAGIKPGLSQPEWWRAGLTLNLSPEFPGAKTGRVSRPGPGRAPAGPGCP